MAFAPIPFAVWRRLGLYSSPEYDLPEAITSTFKIGAVLVMSSGYVTEASANPTAIAGVASAAGQNGAADGTATAQVLAPSGNIVFVGTLDAGLGATAIAQAQLGAQFGITKYATTGIWYVDSAKSASNLRVAIVELIDPVGTVSGRVGFQFIEDFTWTGLGS